MSGSTTSNDVNTGEQNEEIITAAKKLNPDLNSATADYYELDLSKIDTPQKAAQFALFLHVHGGEKQYFAGMPMKTNEIGLTLPTITNEIFNNLSSEFQDLFTKKD